MRALRLLAFLLLVGVAGEAYARNEIIDVVADGVGTRFGGVTVDGHAIEWFVIPYNASYPTAQQACDTALGAGNTTVTAITNGYRVEFTGSYGHRNLTWSNTSLGGVTVSLVQDGAAQTSEEVIAAALPQLVTEMQAANAKADLQTFLLQAVALTLELAAGGFLWRTIVVAARLK